MPYYVISKVMSALNDRKKSLRDSKILILGLAYKKDVDDIRESPSLKLIELLQEKGAKVDYSDEYVKSIPELRKYSFNKKSVKLNEKNLRKYDMVILSTDHSYFDPGFILKHSDLIVDTRNAFAKYKSKKIYKA